MAAITFVNSAVDNTDSSGQAAGSIVRTFAGQTLNAGEAIVIGVFRLTNVGINFNCTVNGVTATQLHTNIKTTTEFNRIGIWRCNVPSNTTGSVVFSNQASGLTINLLSCGMALLRADAIDTAIAAIVGGNVSPWSDPASASLANVPAGAVVVAGVQNQSTNANVTGITWTGSTEVLDVATIEGPRRWGAAAHVQGGAANPLTVTADFAGTPATPVIAAVALTALAAVTGTLGATEGPDVVASTGTVAWQLTLTAVEGSDVVDFTVDVPQDVTATLDATDGPDIVDFTGSLGYDGILDATEADDVAALVGTIEWSAILDAVEESDVAAFAGDVITSGALDANEDSDVIFFEGAVFTAVEGILDATESDDIVLFDGIVEWQAILDAIEESDIVVFEGGIFAEGVLDVVEESDVAAFEAVRMGVPEFENIVGKRAIADIVGKRNVANIIGRRNVADIIGRETTQ